MVLEVIVESDSREKNLRRDEVSKTLNSLAGRADRDQRIEPGVVKSFDANGDEIQFVEPFTKSSIGEAIFTNGARPDTTRTVILVKTPIVAADNYDAAHARLESFIDGATKIGRAAVMESGDPGLSLVDIGQYRAPLLEKLAADNVAVRRIFGDDYRVSVSGLEQPVRWRVTGPLDLAIYFPYYSSVSAN